MQVHPPKLAPLALVLALSTTLSAAPDEGAQPDSIAVPRLPGPEERLEAATPRVRELLTTWDARELQLAALRGQLAATSDRARSIELENEIECLKFETDLQMLRIQAEHARREGQTATAIELEGTIARLSAQRVQSPSKTETPAIRIQLLPAEGEQK